MVLPSGLYGGLLQQLADFVGNSICPPGPGQLLAGFPVRERAFPTALQNSTRRAQTGCMRAKMPPHY